MVKSSIFKLCTTTRGTANTYAASEITTPHSAYAQHIQRSQHEYGAITDIMILLKPIHKTSLFMTNEQLL